MPNAKDDRHPIDQLAEEFAQRLRRGELPALTEYLKQYPELADEIREVFPALVMMEQLKPTSADALGPIRRQPEQIGDYRLLREIGRGGMGIVYEAEQISLGRHVALKVFPAEKNANPTYLERFRREAKTAARLQNTNIVPVFGVGEADGIHYYAMQFIHGESLDKVLSDLRRLRTDHANAAESSALAEVLPSSSMAASLLTGRFESRAPKETASPPTTELTPGLSSATLTSAEPGEYCRNVARIALQVAEGLACAHKQGILHRDIKPSNLMLDWQGNAWITDFGLAKTADDQELTATGDLVGTIRYMAPERFEGTSLPQSDVYALGMTLYEMLTLRPAFNESNRARLMEQILHETPPDPRHVDSSIPRDLETVVLKAIAQDVGRRYATAEELAEDLRCFVEDRPVQARRSGLLERLWRWCRHNRAVTSLIGVIALLLLLFSPAALRRGTQKEAMVDSLQPGCRWSGQARWLPALENGPQITVIVNERDGDTFKGTYIAVENDGRYEWRIEGTMRQKSIQWRFTKVVQELHPTGVVKHAHVEGILDGETLELLYRDADSSAQIKLRRENEAK